MNQRTVYAMAYLVTKLSADAIGTRLGRLLGSGAQAFQLQRAVSLDPHFAAEGFETSLMGFVLRTDERLVTMIDRAQMFADDPGNVGIDFQVLEVPEAIAEPFWVMVRVHPVGACTALAERFPWDASNGKTTPAMLTGPGGDA